MHHMRDDLLTAKDAAARLGVTDRTITRWAEAGKLPTAFQVPTGPTGGFLTVTHPGISGVRVGVGGQLHVADYSGGITGGTLAFATTITGTYGVDVTAVGVGTYS